MFRFRTAKQRKYRSWGPPPPPVCVGDQFIYFCDRRSTTEVAPGRSKQRRFSFALQQNCYTTLYLERKQAHQYVLLRYLPNQFVFTTYYCCAHSEACLSRNGRMWVVLELSSLEKNRNKRSLWRHVIGMRYAVDESRGPPTLHSTTDTHARARTRTQIHTHTIKPPCHRSVICYLVSVKNKDVNRYF